MKKVILVTLLAIFATIEYSNGQFLEPFQGTDGKWGFIDGKGKLAIPFKYDLVFGFTEGLAAVWLNGKGGFIDKTDSVVIPLKYGEVREFSKGMAMVDFNGKYGFIDKTDKVLIPFEFDEVRGFSDHFFRLPTDYAMVIIKGNNGFLNAKYGYIDRTGTKVVSVRYTEEKATRKFRRYFKNNAKY